MSKGEWKNNKIKIISIAVAFACVFAVAMLFLKTGESNEPSAPPPNMKIEYKNGDKITLEASVSRDELFEKLTKKGFKIPPLFLILPDRLEVFCDAEINVSDESAKPSISILTLSFNGLEVPPKLLSEIGEINLDFKRSLVYN